MTSAAPRLSDPRSFAFILVGSALPILAAILTKSWAAGRGDTIAVGPTGGEICLGTTCADASFAKLGMGGEVSAFAVFTILTGVLAIAAAALFGGLVLAHKERKLPPYIAGHAVFGAAAFSMVVFAFRVGAGDEVSMSWGPLFGLAGVGVGWYMLRRLQQALPQPRAAAVAAMPPAAELGAMFGEAAPVAGAPVVATPSTTCPTCKGTAEYIPQYQRSWCARCRQYA